VRHEHDRADVSDRPIRPPRASKPLTRPSTPSLTTSPEASGNSSNIGSLAASAAKLLGSGVISAVALTIITSNRWHLLDSGVGVSLVLFLQWQAFGLTVTKLGVDQVIFAAITENPQRRVLTAAHMRNRALPLALVFSLVVAVVFDPWYGVACFVSTLLDTQSILLLADLNARERYTGVMTASLLNYPLFFLFLFGVQAWHHVTIGLALGLFVMTSFTRWAWLTFHRSFPIALPTLSIQGTGLTGIAPLLNFLMFRVDQVLLGTAVVSTLVATIGSDFIRQLLFLGRYQELLSGGIAILTGMLLPRLHLRYPFVVRDLVRTATSRRGSIFAYVGAVALSLAVYSLVWRGAPIPTILLTCAAVSALLILPANALTYSMIRQGHLRGLVRNLVIVVTIGLGTIVASYVFAAPMIFVIAVPLQLAVFVVLALTSNWLARQHPYESR
jgi:hypothetical protein